MKEAQARVGGVILGLILMIAGGATALLLKPEAVADSQQASTPQVNQATKLTPGQEAALVEVRKILREARQVAEGIVAPSKPLEPSATEYQVSHHEKNKMWLLTNIESTQFRAGDFATAATTAVPGSLAFAQLRYDHLGEALKNVERTELWEEGALTFVYELIQAGQIDSAVKVAETHIKKKRRHEAALFALIAREEARLGDSRAHNTILRARVAAKVVVLPNDRALALVHVARAQRVMGDRTGSEETIREALDTALKAPRGRDTSVLSIIAMAQEENGDRAGSVKTFQLIVDDEKDLKPMQKARWLGSQACDRVLRGYGTRGAEIFQAAIKVADGLPASEQVWVWSEISRWLVKAGDHDAVRAVVQRMVDTAKTISDDQTRAKALSAASGHATKIGDLDKALDIASTMEDGWNKADLLRFIAEQSIKTKNFPNTDTVIRWLADTARTLSQGQLPKDRSQADGMLADTAKVLALAGDVPLAVQTLKRISNQDSHQVSGAYPQIVVLLAQQGNYAGARQILEHVERKWFLEIPVAFALNSLGKAYAESGASQEGLRWARQVEVDYAKASILLGVAEGLMNRHGVENVVTERPEVTLQSRCSVG